MALLFLFRRRRSPREPVNIASPEFKADPFPFYARLRAEAPVYWTVLPTGEPVWLVTRYDDAVAVLKDERFVKNAANAMTPAQLARRPWFRKLLRPIQPHLRRTAPACGDVLQARHLEQGYAPAPGKT
jgi:cytochrome P450 PksS